jgi:hypothetical protein
MNSDISAISAGLKSTQKVIACVNRNTNLSRRPEGRTLVLCGSYHDTTRIRYTGEPLVTATVGNVQFISAVSASHFPHTNLYDLRLQ